MGDTSNITNELENLVEGVNLTNSLRNTRFPPLPGSPGHPLDATGLVHPPAHTADLLERLATAMLFELGNVPPQSVGDALRKEDSVSLLRRSVQRVLGSLPVSSEKGAGDLSSFFVRVLQVPLYPLDITTRQLPGSEAKGILRLGSESATYYPPGSTFGGG